MGEASETRGKNVETQSLAEREFTDKMRKSEYECKPRSRKPKHKVNRSHHCTIGTCSKAYGSLGSLLQHTKIKHPENYHPRPCHRRREGTASIDEVSVSS
jgi:hypothetical protein